MLLQRRGASLTSVSCHLTTDGLAGIEIRVVCGLFYLVFDIVDREIAWAFRACGMLVLGASLELCVLLGLEGPRS